MDSNIFEMDLNLVKQKWSNFFNLFSFRNGLDYFERPPLTKKQNQKKTKQKKKKHYIKNLDFFIFIIFFSNGF